MSKHLSNNSSISRDLFPWKIFTRIIGIQSAIVLIAIGATGIGARFFLQKKLLRQVEDDLNSTVLTLSHELDAPLDSNWCQRMAQNTNFALMVTTKKGTTVCISAGDDAGAGNNARQAAIDEAFRDSAANTVVIKQSKNDKLIFASLAIQSGNAVITVTRHLAQLESTTQTLDQSLAIFLVMMAIVLGLFSLWAGRRMIFPLAGSY